MSLLDNYLEDKIDRDNSGRRAIVLLQAGTFPSRFTAHPSSSYPDPLPEPVWWGCSGAVGDQSLGFLDKMEGLLRRPPTDRLTRNQGTIARITANRLSLERLLAMDPEYLAPVTHLMDGNVFAGGFLDSKSKPPSKRKVSRHMLHHASTLLNMSVVAAPEPGSLGSACYMPIFTTAKKSGELRLVMDARELNKIYSRPPSMDLPRIHDMIAAILDSKFVASADGVSYFYQFPLAPSVRPSFTARLAGARGEFVDVQYTCGVMGWSWMPCIGQRSANVLTRGLGKAWVDNFFVLGNSIEDFYAKRSEFLRRVDHIGLELDDRSLQPQTATTALGIYFDLMRKSYRMDPDWVVKASERLSGLLAKDFLSVEELYVMAGTLTWRHHVCSRALCNLPMLFQAVGKAASSVAKGTIKWSDKVPVSTDLRKEIERETMVLQENAEIFPQSKGDATAEVWSDASDTHWAFLVFEHGRLVVAKQGETKEHNHIFYSELSAAIGGIMAAYRRGHQTVRVCVDNAPACHALQRKVSTNFRANRWLAGIQHLKLDMVWVPSAKQLADPYTRGAGGSPPPQMPPLGTTWEELSRQVREKSAGAVGITSNHCDSKSRKRDI